MGRRFFRGEETTRKGLITLIWVRMALVTVIIGLGIAILGGREELSLEPLFAMLAITTVLSVVYLLGALKGESLRFQATAQLLVDIGLATGMIHYTGGVGSPFALLYVVIITAGSAFLFLRVTILLALLSSASYALLLAGEQSGILGPYGDAAAWSDPVIGRARILEATLYGVTFLCVAVLSGYLSFRVHRRGVDLRDARFRLRQAHLDTDQILRAMSSGLLTVDGDGIVVHFNHAAEEIFGVSAREIIGKRCRDLLRDRSLALVTMVEGILAGGADVRRREITVIHSAGEPVPVGVSASALRSDSGTLAGVVAIFQDLTDVRRMEAQIRHADRLAAIGELSAGIAHEIRNPLATISGSIQVLQSELAVEGEQVRLLGLIVKESDRLHRIVEDFLDFARTGPAHRGKIDIGAILEEQVRLMKNHPLCRPTIDIVLADEMPRVELFADDEQIRRVFANLMVNALEAMPAGGTLTIAVRLHEEDAGGTGTDAPAIEAAIEFRDTGEGIAPEAADYLFRPFMTTKKGGTGLGLAIAQKIVLSHNGRIEAVGEEGGSVFTVYLPCDGVPAEMAESA